MKTPWEFKRGDHVTITTPAISHWDGCHGVVLETIPSGAVKVLVKNSKICFAPEKIKLDLIAQLASLA